MKNNLPIALLSLSMLVAPPVLADCLKWEDVESGIITESNGSQIVWERIPKGPGIIVRIAAGNSGQNTITRYSAHPLLPDELFWGTEISASRVYAGALEEIENLEVSKIWRSDFVKEAETGDAVSGHVTLEFRKHRIERVGDCKYKVWEVLAREVIGSSNEATRRMLYSPELKIVLRRSVSHGTEARVLGAGYGSVKALVE